MNKIKIEEIRIKLHRFENELRKRRGTNKLVDSYLRKVTYMMLWLRLIPIEKEVLRGWSMPDMNTISEFKKKGEDK